jgi:hypothetical protein
VSTLSVADPRSTFPRMQHSSPTSSETIAFADLPQDMQSLIGDFVLGNGAALAIPKRLPLAIVEVASIPVVGLDPFDRGAEYALRMDLDETPPIVIAEGYFMDGKHRAFSARTKARRTLVAIDLSGIIDPTMIDGNEMGRLRPASEEDVTPPIGTTP